MGKICNGPLMDNQGTKKYLKWTHKRPIMDQEGVQKRTKGKLKNEPKRTFKVMHFCKMNIK